MMIGQSEREQFGHAYVVVALNYILMTIPVARA